MHAPVAPSRRAAEDQVAAWAASGAMALTGHADGPPLGPPDGLVPKLRAIAAALPIDPIAVLGERAAVLGLTRQGTTSCGGATRLLRTADGWMAVALARPEDIELVPAWLGIEPDDDPTVPPWAAIERALGLRRSTEVLDAARGLGLPIAALAEPPEHRPEPPDGDAVAAGLPVGWTRIDAPAPPLPSAVQGLRVVDLSSLWAGPLCGSLLADLGASVVKVESSARPDGARSGPPAFFDLLNGAKEQRSVDLRTAGGRAELGRIVAGADIVIEGSRPRALRALGLDAERLLAGGTPRVWVSITGHGRTGAGADRVAFGDDAAVAGGLVAWDADGRPVFCADAVADPVTGLVAAAAAVKAVSRGGSWLLDASMARAGRHLAGPTLPVGPDVVAAPPRARRP